jgi:ferredoxin
MRSFRRVTRSSWNRFAPARSPSSKIWWLIARPSTGSFRPAVSFRAHRQPPRCQCRAVPKPAEIAMDAAQCIGCGACVAACKNASAMLFRGRQLRTSTTCRRAKPEKAAARSPWSTPWTRGLRQLHQLLRVRSGLPQGNPREIHRGNESRISQGRAHRSCLRWIGKRQETRGNRLNRMALRGHSTLCHSPDSQCQPFRFYF